MHHKVHHYVQHCVSKRGPSSRGRGRAPSPINVWVLPQNVLSWLGSYCIVRSELSYALQGSTGEVDTKVLLD